jgi:protoporphyrin/coproporphyrin ferrochelatase
MALRQPLSQFARIACRSKGFPEATAIPWQKHQRRQLATASALPVTQVATSSKGPTAIVFMNMGGPSTTAEVGDFLSRLFVSFELIKHSLACRSNPWHRQMPT